MEEQTRQKTPFIDLLRKDMSREEFQELVSRRLTTKDKKVIGREASMKVALGFEALAVMAPYPVHYGLDIIEQFIQSGIKFKTPQGEKRVEMAEKSILRIIDIGKREGILTERSDNRLEIDKRLSVALYRLVQFK